MRYLNTSNIMRTESRMRIRLSVCQSICILIFGRNLIGPRRVPLLNIQYCQMVRIVLVNSPFHSHPFLFNVIHLSSGTAIGTSEADAASQILNRIFTKWTIRRKREAIVTASIHEICLLILQSHKFITFIFTQLCLFSKDAINI